MKHILDFIMLGLASAFFARGWINGAPTVALVCYGVAGAASVFSIIWRETRAKKGN